VFIRCEGVTKLACQGCPPYMHSVSFRVLFSMKLPRSCVYDEVHTFVAAICIVIEDHAV
jgi:hypothetical protein